MIPSTLMKHKSKHSRSRWRHPQGSAQGEGAEAPTLEALEARTLTLESELKLAENSLRASFRLAEAEARSL